jgi:hypothetical protein
MNESLGKNSAAYIAYMIINVIWYISLATFTILAIVMGISYWNPSFIDFNMALPINPSAVEMTQEYSYLEIDEVNAHMDLSHVIESRSGLYLGWSVYILGIAALFLYGFNQLRLLLKSTVYDAIFSSENIAALKKLAFTIMAFDPLTWIYDALIINRLGSIVDGSGFEIGVVSFKIGYLLTGLLIYVLSTIFEKGYRMYEELKLTI